MELLAGSDMKSFTANTIINQGLRLAVLAIDPSSMQSKGSILVEKEDNPKMRFQ